MRRFYSPPETIDLSAGTIFLPDDEARHLRDVLRLKTGDSVSVFDGVGNEYTCKIASSTKKSTVLEIFAKSAPDIQALDLTFAVSLLKGEKFDLVVQKLSELGVTRLVPLTTKRADVKIKDEKEGLKKVLRWRRISLESAKQCGRNILMEITEPIAFESYLKEISGEVVLFSERDGASIGEIPAATNRIAAIVGPEGGWDDLELENAKKMRVKIITLKGNILRAETAAITAAALMGQRFGLL